MPAPQLLPNSHTMNIHEPCQVTVAMALTLTEGFDCQCEFLVPKRSIFFSPVKFVEQLYHRMDSRASAVIHSI